MKKKPIYLWKQVNANLIYLVVYLPCIRTKTKMNPRPGTRARSPRLNALRRNNVRSVISVRLLRACWWAISTPCTPVPSSVPPVITSPQTIPCCGSTLKREPLHFYQHLNPFKYIFLTSDPVLNLHLIQKKRLQCGSAILLAWEIGHEFGIILIVHYYVG